MNAFHKNLLTLRRIMRNWIITHRRLALRLALVLVVSLLAVTAWYCLVSRQHINQNDLSNYRVSIRRATSYSLYADGKKIIDFDPDTTALDGCWEDRFTLVPSSFGRILVIDDTKARKYRFRGIDLRQWLEEKNDSIEKLLKDEDGMLDEMRYYLRVHSVRDEGFSTVADLYTVTRTKYDSLKLIYDSVCHHTNKKSKLTIRYNCHYYYGKERLKVLPSIHQGYVLLQSVHMPFRAIGRPRLVARLLASFFYRSRPLDIDWSLFPDRLGNIYSGEVDSLGRYDGYGCLKEKDGSYYDGQWRHGKRNGFGFSLRPGKAMRVGEWKEDSYQGERLVYNKDRIYGIDISKYQHIMHKKRYAIDWAHLRITSLGSMSQKEVHGTIDYPISFIFIKNTEGRTVFNPYYARDYKAAKAHGYKIGTYHYFTTRSSGYQQAMFFLRHSHVSANDLPPVLDVEPLPSQIRKMGGVAAMFREIRTWLRIVENHTGKRPILYISQIFVNRYLDRAPDLKHNYPVWIARYGQYKPDIRLVIWQLSPDGHVRGIVGHTDINVFNGYRNEFERWAMGNK